MTIYIISDIIINVIAAQPGLAADSLNTRVIARKLMRLLNAIVIPTAKSLFICDRIDRTCEKFDRQFPIPTQQTAATPNSAIAASGPTKEIYGSMKYFLAASRACEAVTCTISS